ncbi:hypothetical protein [Butyrivibrio sp. AD3002]|uniref:hypothetical protein n=1 Tax=Butyrivibrio sp. AD3002 TaxID=1280670 RepID=UPI0003B5E504|nr:hypothetical protein [Butyrivibrio sp. AD3002]
MQYIQAGYGKNFWGEQVLWITDPKQISMEHMKFVGGYPNGYCIYLSELPAEEQAEILEQLR